MQQSISQKIIIQRFYSLLLNSVGEMLSINFISGDIIEGILYSIDPYNNEYFIIINPRRLSRTGVPIFLKESKLKIYFKDITFINFEIKNLLPTQKNNFETDFQISKKNQKNEKFEKKLVKYQINENDKNIYINQSLEDEINIKNKDEKWDQFEVNKIKELNDYADKIYNEIKNSSNNEKNRHILEDRGIIGEEDGDADEEEKYSSVIKNKNKDINNTKNNNIK